MTSKQVAPASSSPSPSTLEEDDAKLMKQLEDDLKNAALNDDDDDGLDDSSSSSSASSAAATKMQANLLTAREQEVAGKKAYGRGHPKDLNKLTLGLPKGLGILFRLSLFCVFSHTIEISQFCTRQSAPCLFVAQ